MKKIWSQHRVILLSLSLTVVLVAIRIIYTGTLSFIFIVWNLFLAWVPYFFSILLRHNPQFRPWVRYLLLMSWLLFFPNAPYIITDLFHLRQRPFVPLWYDTVILFWASWNGFLLGFLSLMNVEHYLRSRFREKWVAPLVNFSLVLCAFGVYAGRYLRWNSWDVVTKPDDILQDVKFIVMNPQDNLRTWGVTFLFSILMMTCYFTIKKMKESMAE
jgi:uncharacterized membrane protein